jgi:hypothetical protein
MEEIVIPVIGILLPALIVGTVLGIRHLAQRREMAHKERMRALEMGFVPHEQGQMWKALTCTFIGAGVPTASFAFAWLASLTSHGRLDEAWPIALVVSIVSVVSGGRLARTLFSPSSVNVPRTSETKPIFDPDTYDVAGRRG